METAANKPDKSTSEFSGQLEANGAVKLEEWFSIELTQQNPNRGQIWMRAKGKSSWEKVRPHVTSYFEGAHADARQYFHKAIGLSLDPRGGKQAVEYPRSLPIQTKKGYFGEVFCGIVAEAKELFGKDRWTVPVFLFRLHREAEEFLMRLVLGESVSPQVPGRTGSDSIALLLSPAGDVSAILASEAKCHETFNITKARTALKELAEQANLPVSLFQLKRLLEEISSTRYAATILSLEQIIASARNPSVPRHDLFLIIFDDPSSKNYDEPRLSLSDIQACYSSSRPLNVVEIHLPGAETIIADFYDKLYQRA